MTYTGYTRVNVARSTGFNAASGGSTSPASNINFPIGSGGSGLVTNFATAKSNATPPTGAQVILWSGTVTPNIAFKRSSTSRSHRMTALGQ